MSVANCASCGAEILWAVTPKGERAPVDSEPVANGNVLLLRPLTLAGEVLAVVVAGSLLEGLRGRGIRLRLNHWASCPDKAAWRERTDAKRKAESGDG